MTGNVVQSDVSRRYRTYDPPPAGFDSQTASQAALRRYGLPRRPDPDTEPKLAALWKQVFDRPTTSVKAQVASDPLRNRPRPAAPPPYIPPGSWGGAQVAANSADANPMIMVFAQWVVPTVYPFNQTGEDFYIAFWVGLFGGGSLLQAGVQAKVHADTSAPVTWDAVFEWYSGKYRDPSNHVTNFPVAPGDTVSFLICATQPNVGYVSMSNISRGLHTSVTVIPSHTDLALVGPQAVWAVETTSTAELPVYDWMEFSSCVCCTQSQLYELNAQFTVVTNVTSQSDIGFDGGLPLTGAYVASPSRLMVPWLAFN
jgi:hypothetical protein